jgi:ferredoxin-NADP reductase/MOSC domain-containing protein YiiM
MTNARLVSANVGLPKDVRWRDETVRTGIWKRPVDGPAMVRRLNIEGDGQGDLAGHGGEQRAVLVYQTQALAYWAEQLGRHDLEPGCFGENLTVDGLPDTEVRIGDRYRIGEAEFEVTQPRVTCYRLGMRLDEPDLPALLVAHHRPGFYMRVITEGRIRAGDGIVRTRTGTVTVADTDALLYLPGRDRATLRLAADTPALSPGWRGSFLDLLAEPEPPPGPAWPGFRPLRVTDVHAETPTVTSLRLAAADGTHLPPARPGQFLTLRLPTTGAPVRTYSLSSAPGADTYRISVRHEPHGLASGYLTTAIEPGTLLDSAAPRGDFTLTDDTAPVLLLSAGIGITPVLAMLHSLAAARSPREIWWIHSARSPEEQPLAAEAHALVAALPSAHEHVFYSANAPEPGPGIHSGRLAQDALAALHLPPDAEAYLCGPASFMTDMRAALVAVGLAAGNIRTELFGALPAINPGVVERDRAAPHPPKGIPGTGPQVTFARSGLSVPFDAGLHSLLDLADACDVPTRWSCRSGVCHTCISGLLSGDVGYSPDPLDPPPAGQVLLCCARPETDVVLDV